MSIDLRRGHINVPQQILDASDVRARLQQMRGKGMAQGMRSNPLVQARGFGGLANGVLKSGVQDMMDGVTRIVELGDGQVSDRKKWTAQQIIGVLRGTANQTVQVTSAKLSS